MTQVNFYTLSSEDSQSRYQFACRLAEKAVALGHRVLINTGSAEQARQIDDLLWEFKPGSFIPHRILTDEKPILDTEQVLISTGTYPEEMEDVLINLREEPCQQTQRFNRINEILTADPELLEAGRNSYRFYQSRGLRPDTHKL